MKALTICQPYAHLIVIGGKTTEFRTWPTTYRGPLAIHAGKSTSWLDDDDRKSFPSMAFGAVVGIAELIECQTCGPYQWDWYLANVCRVVTPIPLKGQLRLFEIPNEILRVPMVAVGRPEPGA